MYAEPPLPLLIWTNYIQMGYLQIWQNAYKLAGQHLSC